MFHKSSKKPAAFFIWTQLLLAFTIENLLLGSSLSASTIYVTSNSGDDSTGTLNAAIIQAQDGDTIDCSMISGQTILIGPPLPAIGNNFTTTTSSITILGSGVTVEGGGITVFSLAQGYVTIADFIIQNSQSIGGAGGSGFTGGGGGTGGGGALYVHAGTVMTISALSLNNNQAIGGAGGDGTATGGSGGGGGGYGGGPGGVGTSIAGSGSGGGGGGNNGGKGGGNAGHVAISNSFENFGGAGGGGGATPVTTPPRAGSGGTNASNPSTTGGAGGVNNTSYGGGGGGGAGVPTMIPPPSSLGGDGFTGADATSSAGGMGGNGGNGFGIRYTYGCGGAGGGDGGGTSGGSTIGGSTSGGGTAGGGGGFTGLGGNGGELGGGGGASVMSNGGSGGFGAGGGAGVTGGSDIYFLGGTGGATTGLPAGGGGGSGLGGAILIQEGALLIIQDGTSFGTGSSGNSTSAGIGGTAASGGNNGEDGSSLGEDIFIQAGGGLTFQINGTLSIPNPIEGAASFSSITGPGVIQSGSGTVSLNGANTYLDGTLIQSGTINLNGSVIGDITIQPAGTLSGNATVGGILYNNGTIAPGNSIGTVNTTDLFLSSTSIYDVEINNAGMSDEIIASGLAQIAGGVVVTPDSVTTPQTYTILSAGTGVTGTFSSLTSTVPSLMSLIYNPLTVQLTYFPLSTIGLKGNALSAASCFATLSALPGSDAAAVSAALIALSPDAIQTAFEQMGPAQFSGPTQVQLLDAILVRSTYTKHLQMLWFNEDKSCKRPVSLWGEVIGQWQKQMTTGSNFGYNDTTVGGTIGADYSISHFVVGSALSYTYDNFHWHNSAGKGDINSYYGGLYGRFDHEGFYINAALLGAHNKYNTKRHLHFGAIDRHAHAKHSGNEWLANFGFGYQESSSNIQWTPYINLDYVQTHERGYTESGAQSLDLHVKTKNAELLQGEVGILLSTSHRACNGVFIPTLTLAYVNQTPFSSKKYHAHFVDSSCVFIGKGLNYERNLFAPRLALAYQGLGGLVDVSINYDAQVGSRYWAQDVGFTLALRF